MAVIDFTAYRAERPVTSAKAKIRRKRRGNVLAFPVERVGYSERDLDAHFAHVMSYYPDPVSALGFYKRESIDPGNAFPRGVLECLGLPKPPIEPGAAVDFYKRLRHRVLVAVLAEEG